MSELQHYGIKGQKWGERRYQYEDGTLTPAGKLRYGNYVTSQNARSIINAENDVYRDPKKFHRTKEVYEKYENLKPSEYKELEKQFGELLRAAGEKNKLEKLEKTLHKTIYEVEDERAVLLKGQHFFEKYYEELGDAHFKDEYQDRAKWGYNFSIQQLKTAKSEEEKVFYKKQMKLYKAVMDGRI